MGRADGRGKVEGEAEGVSPRSHLAGCLVPFGLALLVALVALTAVGLPMAFLLALFGTDPFSSIAFVLMTDRGTLAGVVGALVLGLAMWIAHLLDRRLSWPVWIGIGTAGYASGALAIWALVPQTSAAS